MTRPAQASRLWRFQEVLYEQLDLEFQSALVLQVQGLAPPVNGFRAPFTAMWTTSPAANDMLGSGVVRGTIVRTSFEDTNRDGVGDIFRASASMPLLPGESVLSATLVAYFDVRLHVRGGAGGGVGGGRVWALFTLGAPECHSPPPKPPRPTPRTSRDCSWTA